MGERSGSVESVVIMQKSLSDFYNGKKVFITGHTSFKGAWLCEALSLFGADITGYSYGVPTNPSLFEICKTENKMDSHYGDIRDLEELRSVFDKANPEIVFHLAAQPIVRESYRDPVKTYSINVMGTVNILECVRKNEGVKSFLNITTDKVYNNKEWDWGYREIDELDGYDPYSNSKSCSELVTHCFWGDGLRWIDQSDGGPHEASYLKLDCSKLKNTFDWKPIWNLDEAIKRVVEWSKCWIQNGDIGKCIKEQIDDFMYQWKSHFQL